jgi:hypothetical protein
MVPNASSAILSSAIAWKYTNRSGAILANPSPVVESVLKMVPNASLPNLTHYNGMTKTLAAARAMISENDDNHVMDAFWLPPEAPLFLLMPPKKLVRSESVSRLIRANRTVIPIWGEADGALSPNQDLLLKCINGTLDANSDQCASAYQGIRYRIDPRNLEEALTRVP